MIPCYYYYPFCNNCYNAGLFRDLSIERIYWANYTDKWILLKTSQDNWIFGKIEDYNSSKKTIKLLALINEKFKYIEESESDIIEVWFVDKWSKYIPYQNELDVSGKWDTNWGELVLTQSGNKVTGTYVHDKGKIKGGLIGNVLKGTWSEAPTYAPNKDAGNFEFTFTENSFKGKWGYGNEKLTGTWTGTRK